MFQGNGPEAGEGACCDSGDGIRREQPPKIITRYAREDDIVEYFGDSTGETVRAIVAEVDGKVAGIVGVVREDSHGMYFSNFSEDLRPYLRSVAVMRAIKQSMDIVRAYRGPVISIAETVEGCRILNRLGFRHLEGAIYGWVN